MAAAVAAGRAPGVGREARFPALFPPPGRGESPPITRTRRRDRGRRSGLPALKRAAAAGGLPLPALAGALQPEGGS